MDAGMVVEYDHPYNLLENKLGHFHQMVEQTGQISADVLYNAASHVGAQQLIKLVQSYCKINLKIIIFGRNVEFQIQRRLCDSICL